MAVYSNRRRWDALDLDYRPDSDKVALHMDTLSESSSRERINILIAFIFVLEILALILVLILEYFLRFTDLFPVRQLNFTCTDPEISYTKDYNSFADFAYNADISFELIVAFCFALPPVVMLVGELAFWAFTQERQKTIRALCKPCRVPQVIRRMIRFIGAYWFGLVVSMIFADVTRVMTGRLRPTFLAVCQPNMTECMSAVTSLDDSFRQQTDLWRIREARMSFPNLHSTMTAFAGVFMAAYLHCLLRAPALRIIRPGLSLGFLMLAILCGLAEYGLRKAFWIDVAVGLVLGLVIAVYISVCVLNNFEESLTGRKLYTRLRSFLAHQRAVELRDHYKENWERLERSSFLGSNRGSYTHGGALSIPRPHLNNGLYPSPSMPSELDEMDFRRRAQASYQRDVPRAVDQLRRDSDERMAGHI